MTRAMNTRRHGNILIGLAALLPLVAFAGFAVFAALGSYRALDETRLRSTARALASAVDAELGRYIAALETLAQSQVLDDPLDIDAVVTRFRAVGDAWGGWIVLIDQPPGYRMLAHTLRSPDAPLPPAIPPDSPPALSEPIAAVFRDGQPAVSDLFVGQVTGWPTLAAMVAVDRPGQPRRVLALAFRPDSLRELLARQALPPPAFSAIADGQMRVLGYSLDTEGRRVGQPAPDWVAAALEGQQSTIIVGPGWRGHDNVYAVERLRRAPSWKVAVAEPLTVQRASAWAAVRWLVIGIFAIGLGLAVIVWSNRREVVRDARREAAALRAGRAEVERLHGRLPAVIFLREMAPDGSSRNVYRGGDVEAVLGWPAKEVAQRHHFEDLVHPEDATLTQLGLRLLREGHVSNEWRLRQPDGSWRAMQTTALVLTRRPDGGAEIVGYTVDVSAQRAAEASAMAAARLASLGEMAAGLAHEMKQPLQTISLAAENAQMFLAQGKAVEVDRRLGRIVEQTQRTAELIEHLRRFARGADVASPPEPVVLAAAIEGAMALAHSALREADIAVEVALCDPAPVVRGKMVLVEQVLSNLLLNARDALVALPAGAPRRIRISAAPGAGATVVLTVADTGGGIAPAVLARVFEPFVTTKAADEGTGLGLSICRDLVTGMGGTIEARNTAEGAVFTIALPAALGPGAAP